MQKVHWWVIVILTFSASYLAIAASDADTSYNAVTFNDDEQQLRYLKEELWPKAYREQDAVLLADILDEQFQMIDANGIWTNKKQELMMLSDFHWTHDDFSYTIKRLEIFNDTAAIIAGEGRATGTDNGNPYCLRYQSSNLLVKRGHQWKAVSSHVSGVHSQCPFTSESD